MKMSEKQLAALKAAAVPGGLFQLPERRTHAPGVLSALVKRGWLNAEKVGVVWTITEAGAHALEQQAALASQGKQA